MMTNIFLLFFASSVHCASLALYLVVEKYRDIVILK